MGFRCFAHSLLAQAVLPGARCYASTSWQHVLLGAEASFNSPKRNSLTESVVGFRCFAHSLLAQTVLPGARCYASTSWQHVLLGTEASFNSPKRNSLTESVVGFRCFAHSLLAQAVLPATYLRQRHSVGSMFYYTYQTATVIMS